MADGGDVQSDSSNTTILRVKRKRTEDPADLLLVCHAFKKYMKEEQLPAVVENKDTSVQRVFRLAGTVLKSDHNLLSPEVLTKLKYHGQHKSKVKTRFQNDVIVESINDKLRKTKKLTSQRSRYKIISKHREGKESPRESSENESNETNDNDQATDEEILKLYRMYDVALDETESAETKLKEESAKNDEDPNAILCNSVKMIREKLKIETGSSTNSELVEKDYVYDVYCAEDNYGDLCDVFDIVRVNESQLVSDIDEDTEHYDDEDDSNDENNWRNDYPDEDEWAGSSEEESRYTPGNFDYGCDDGRHSRKMVSENFSSDEDDDFAYFGQKYECGNGKDEYNFEIVDED